MSGKLLRFSGNAHDESMRLLPWLANGTLQGEEREFVEAHLVGCAMCRSELDALHLVRETCLQDDPAASPPGFARLRARIDAEAPRTTIHAPRAMPWSRLFAGWSAAPRWLQAAACVQAALLLAVAIAWPWNGGTGSREYRTLGNGAMAGIPARGEATLMLVLSPDTSQGETRRLLRASAARIIDGPSDAGAYVIAVDARRAAAVRDALRAAPGVQLVERLDPESRQ